MRKSMNLAFLVFLAACGTAATAYADEPNCATIASGPFCSYTGQVEKAYVNEHDRILLYFDTPLNLAAPGSVGISGVTKTSAAIARISEDPDFAKMLYATMLSAQAQQREVSIQMRGVFSGYLVIDRIWLN